MPDWFEKPFGMWMVENREGAPFFSTARKTETSAKFAFLKGVGFDFRDWKHAARHGYGVGFYIVTKQDPGKAPANIPNGPKSNTGAREKV